MPRVPSRRPTWERALEVMGQPAATRRQRAAAIPGLLIAAVAERVGLILLDCERAFETVARITGQTAQARGAAREHRLSRVRLAILPQCGSGSWGWA